jgi:hypothetical protein
VGDEGFVAFSSDSGADQETYDKAVV